MNKDWAEKNKEIQTLLSKEATFRDAIQKLIAFREELFQQITWIVEGYPDKAFYQLPFAGAKGYYSKTLAYSIWHIFRIEDIVALQSSRLEMSFKVKTLSLFQKNWM